MKSRLLFMALFSFVVTLSCDNSADLKPKTNSPPVITSVIILCRTPHIQAELNAVAQCQDPDHDPVANHYQWLKNGEEILAEDSYTLRNGKLRKGDLVQVRVTPSDGKINGTPFLSAGVKILNSPPVIEEVRIEPRVAYVNDSLKALIQCSDADGDSVHYTYQWEKNGIFLGERNDTLQRGQFKRGDSIAVAVTPDDGESLGTPKKSETIIVSNRPPVIVSSPSNKMDGNTYAYQVQANDPDDDPIIFILKSAPQGMEINKETGLIRWKIDKGDHGTQIIEVEASDSEGGKTIQKYTLSVTAR